MYPESMRYTKEHEWVEVQENGTARVGITDYAQKELGDIVYVELPSVGDEFEQGEAFGVVESVKAVSDLYMPISGKVKDVNKELENQPESINASPHDDGWIITLEISDEEEISGLMSAEEYEEFLNEVGGGGDKKKKKKVAAKNKRSTEDDDEDEDEEELDGFTEEGGDDDDAGGGRGRASGGLDED
jgi:glycine cleavage system H protein